MSSVGSSSSVSSSSVEICARNLLDISFKYTWLIEEYLNLLDSRVNIDSPTFDFYLNGLKSKWSLAIRYWTDEDGRRLSNPVVICLNLVSSISEIREEIEVRYQFGVWNEVVKQYEVSPLGSQLVTLAGPVSQDLISLGYRELYILDTHLLKKNVQLFSKIMIVRSKVEENTLALDLWNKMKNNEHCDVILISNEGDRFPVHKTIIFCRSRGLGKLISKMSNTMVNLNMSTSILTGLLQYIYTDRVDPLKTPIALLKISVNFELPGLKNICEKALIDSITPKNVASLIWIADNFFCEALKKAGLAYLEENARSIVKTITWEVMEHVNPELFEEVCQSQG